MTDDAAIDGNRRPFQERLEGALETIARMLAADGYELTSGLSDDVLDVQITAGPDACEDCLSPRTVLEPMIHDMLDAAGLGGYSLRLTYPSERTN